MSLFSVFADAVAARWLKMQQHELFTTSIVPDALWDHYLAAFPKGTNEIFRERTEHDGSYDRNFIKRVGNVVAITDAGEVISLWDNLPTLPYPYNVVADHLASVINDGEITGLFRNKEQTAGNKPNVEMIDGKPHTWHHFYAILGKAYDRNAAATVGAINTNVGVMKRSLETITPEAVSTVLDLIEQNSLYRGAEFKANIQTFQRAQTLYGKQKSDNARNIILWLNCRNNALLIRNTAIGTLLVELSEGVGLELAVGRFEAMVAPMNYKRPTALVTPAMINSAMEKIDELGLHDSLDRRHAVIEDLNINDVLWADSSAKSVMKGADLKAALLSSAVVSVTDATMTKVSVEDFMSKILPKAVSVELLLKNNLKSNMVSISAPGVDGAPQLFKWGNGFAWSYAGNVTDSIKERVKAAGGNTDAPLRVSLAWFNGDDLDLHSQSPNGRVGFSSKFGTGQYQILDVDMNAGAASNSRDPVENHSFRTLKDGKYSFTVNNYSRRSGENFGYEVQVECGDFNTTLSSKTSPRTGGTNDICSFEIKNGALINFETALESSARSVSHWGLQTESFVRVKTALLSPNHWGDQAVDNKHYFFLLEGAVNPEETRGVYNEYLRSDLEQHRKVFELVGAKTKIPAESDTNRQLSGVGFSSTVRKSAVFKADNRLYEVQF